MPDIYENFPIVLWVRLPANKDRSSKSWHEAYTSEEILQQVVRYWQRCGCMTLLVKAPDGVEIPECKVTETL